MVNQLEQFNMKHLNMDVVSLVFIDLLGQVFNQYHAENERKKWITEIR